jgi:hypothetical protein
MVVAFSVGRAPVIQRSATSLTLARPSLGTPNHHTTLPSGSLASRPSIRHSDDVTGLGEGGDVEPELTRPNGTHRGLVRFVGDLRWSVRVWKIDPRLPVAAFSVAAVEVVFVATAPSHTAPVKVVSFGCLAVLVWLAGFRGVERMWYDRVGLGWGFSWSEIRQCNGDLRGRFIRLGILVVVPFGLAVSPLKHAPAGVHYGVIGATWFIVDAFLTFVTVRLALITDNVREAIAAGLSVLRRTWPSCALYVLLPPLGLQLLIEAGAGFGIASRVAAGVVVAPMALASRGATVRYYDREVRELSVHQ